MKIHFNSIHQHHDKYIYEYHAQREDGIFKSIFIIFAIAGIIGSFTVVNERGWLYLFPFWISVIILMKVIDWLLKKTESQNNLIKVRFIAEYPHYFASDIIWMLQCTDQNILFSEVVKNASEDWGKEIDIEIGKLSVMKTSKANFTKEILKQAIGQQVELKNEWSLGTGMTYPDLGMPRRVL